MRHLFFSSVPNLDHYETRPLGTLSVTATAMSVTKWSHHMYQIHLTLTDPFPPPTCFPLKESVLAMVVQILEIQSRFIAQAGLELRILLTQPAECWGFKHVSPCLDSDYLVLSF